VSWFLRSYADQDTHRGSWRADGLVHALCGVVFAPLGRMEVTGPPPDRLVDASPALPGPPPDPAQACPACQQRVAR
jgi:hypothetical protein